MTTQENRVNGVYMTSYRSVLVYISLWLAFSCYATPLPPRTMTSFQSRQLFDTQCTFEGNPEIYSLGIRLGIYLQWISALMANLLHANGVQDMLATNTIFLLALFIALVISTTTSAIQSAEVVILLQLCVGFMFIALSTCGSRVRARYTTSPELQEAC